uniref:Uncharacterized protein n=1 Tax=Anguilla anguilla TaxID=7936 RepID=A0A0E9PHD2_ANGAN
MFRRRTADWRHYVQACSCMEMPNLFYLFIYLFLINMLMYRAKCINFIIYSIV